MNLLPKINETFNQDPQSTGKVIQRMSGLDIPVNAETLINHVVRDIQSKGKRALPYSKELYFLIDFNNKTYKVSVDFTAIFDVFCQFRLIEIDEITVSFAGVEYPFTLSITWKELLNKLNTLLK
jgi:hypothetical protein